MEWGGIYVILDSKCTMPIVSLVTVWLIGSKPGKPGVCVFGGGNAVK